MILLYSIQIIRCHDGWGLFMSTSKEGLVGDVCRLSRKKYSNPTEAALDGVKVVNRISSKAKSGGAR